MDRKVLANRLARMARRLEAGKINGPGIPDGTGPWWGGGPGSGFRKGPCVFEDEEEIEDVPVEDQTGNVAIAKRLAKIAGKLMGPGIPDGTGPGRETGSCPYDKEDDEEEMESGRKTAQHLENVKALPKMTDRETARAIRDAIIAEEGAINQYEAIVDSTGDGEVKKVLQDIANEEKVHVGELQKLLADMLVDEQGFLDEGAKEVEGENED